MTMSFSRVLPTLAAFLIGHCLALASPSVIRATRMLDRPIVAPAMLPGDDGESINGPSLIRVPDWVQNRLGRYYLYFAHHNGKYIRFAYADDIAGPWTLVQGGLLPLAGQKVLRGHIASPEAVIDDETRQIYLFTHGPPREGGGSQISTVAVSSDGRTFRDLGVVVGPAYLRVFRQGSTWYALNGSGRLLQTKELGTPFQPVGQIIGQDILDALDPWLRDEPGATPPERRPKDGDGRYDIRHVGTDLHDGCLFIYFSCLNHRPERIIVTKVELRGPPVTWRASGVFEVLQPERPWEGADLPLAYSRGGSTIKYGYNRVRELRDPMVYRDGDDAWLLYSVAGEYGLGLAKLHYEAAKP